VTAARVQGILFDLDGTLADTAADLARAVNTQRRARSMAPLALSELRPLVSQGARGMLRAGFGLAPDSPGYGVLREEFLSLYEANLCRETTLFPGMEPLLAALERDGLSWGVVTNKHARFTEPLIVALGLETRAACIVSGDTCARAKPHPDPLLEAARRLRLDPAACIYVGDDERDVQAARAAGMRSVIALYGYLGDGNAPERWGGDYTIDRPLDLLNLLGLPPAVR
jgi:phosphoglycolate phosphatase